MAKSSAQTTHEVPTVGHLPDPGLCPPGLWCFGTVVSRRRKSIVNDKTGKTRWVTTLDVQCGPDRVSADRWTARPVPDVPELGANIALAIRTRTFFGKGGLRTVLEWGPVESDDGSF